MADCFQISLRVKKLFLMCFIVFLMLNSSQMRNNFDESLVLSAELPVLDCFDSLRSGLEISCAAAGLNNHLTVCDYLWLFQPCCLCMMDVWGVAEG